jgi:O-antigen ligase/tetratricopeptide (TPR) repeat protein
VRVHYDKLFDRLVTGALIFLILFSPLAFGSVHPWAFALMEAVLFLLVIVWIVKFLLASGTDEGAAFVTLPLAKKLAIPLLLFFALTLFQLLPLPPGLLRFLSPATFEVYSRSLSGWPGDTPYASLLMHREQNASRLTPHASPTTPVLLPTPEEVRSGVPIPFEDQRSEVRDRRSEVSGQTPDASRLTPNVSPLTPHVSRLTVFPETWRPLSLAPSHTRSDLLKLAAYSALFFLVLLYPFADRRGDWQSPGQRSEVRGQRRGDWRSPGQRSAVSGQSLGVLLTTIILSGLIVAAVGFIQRFSWNGKILWFFVPYDWGVAQFGGDSRASGPFVNPDHFANYLALIFPLALGLFFHTRSIVGKESEAAFKIFSGLTAIVTFTSILLSLSRSGWMIVCLSIAVLLWLSPWPSKGGSSEHGAAVRDQRSEISSRRRLVLRGSLIVFSVLLIISLFFVGPGGRQQVDARLQETVMHDLGIAGRANVWNDTLKMIRDFPLFGVGLGSWQDLFQRYRTAPWSQEFYREAHNDYLELLTETGIVGFVLLAWFFLLAGKTLLSYVRWNRPSEDTGSKALVGALLAALGAMAFHEFFDFSLQIPANAFLFTLLIALALRIASEGRTSEVRDQKSETRGLTPHPSRLTPYAIFRFMPHASRLTPFAVFTLSVFLIVAAFNQEMTPYPHNLKMPATVTSAKDMLLAHPALPTPHLYLLTLVADKIPLASQVNELRAALWLNPTNPAVRDVYALALLQSGKKEEGLREITQSVLNSPSFSAHYYLNSRLLPWLSAEEKRAVETGFKRAVALEYPEAIENLAGFFARTGRFSDQGKLYEDAAVRAREADTKADLTIKAAASYLQAGDEPRAEPILGKAASLMPKDSRPYQMLAVKIYGPRKDTTNIDKTIAEGIKNGAPSFDLQLAHAEAMHRAGVPDETKKALARAQEALRKVGEQGYEPLRLYLSLSEAAQRLGFRDEARSALLQALELRPSSSEILQRLAQFYFQENNFDRAAYYFRRYLDLNPDASDAFYSLALAEEGQYRFAAAAEAYHRAVELAPDHDGYRQRYESLKARVDQNRKPDR